MKRLILSFLTALPLLASEQIILVVANDFNTSNALLQRYEQNGEAYHKTGAAIRVNLGRNGLGWGIGKTALSNHHDEPKKQEGDGRAPAGIFPLQSVFGYTATADTKMPYMQASNELICVDDAASSHYNTIIPIGPNVVIRSFEWMKRDDDLYALGVTVAHNPDQIASRGSCIFLHVEKGRSSPTAGCTSMRKKELETIITWLDPDQRPLLIQIPKAYCTDVQRRYPGVTCQ